jgi:hypothetical protein
MEFGDFDDNLPVVLNKFLSVPDFWKSQLVIGKFTYNAKTYPAIFLRTTNNNDL